MVRIFRLGMYCEPLTSNPKNKELIKDFWIEREDEYEEILQQKRKVVGLERYLKYCAWDEDSVFHSAKFYVIKTYFTHEIIAYFGLRAGLVSTTANANTEKETFARKQGIKLVPDVFSGIEISHFAVNDNYRKRHGNPKGLGRYLYPSFIYPLIKKASRMLGVQLVYLYAADTSKKENKASLVDYYRKAFNFSEVKEEELKPVVSYYDNNCVFMFQKL